MFSASLTSEAIEVIDVASSGTIFGWSSFFALTAIRFYTCVFFKAVAIFLLNSRYLIAMIGSSFAAYFINLF